MTTKYLRLIQSILFFGGICLLISCKEDPAPQTELDGLTVPEGFSIERAVDPELLSYPMFASFDDGGRLFVFESTEPNTMGTEAMLADPSYHIRLLEDSDGNGVFDKSQIFADNIPLPMGGAFYRGSLYVAAPPNLERLTDTDGDGVADEREVVLTGWTLNSNAATLSGPFVGPDGWFYMADARRGFEIESQEGTVLKGKGARIWRCRPDGSGLESLAGGGFDNAIEIVFTPSGETIGTMTYFMDPQDGQRDALMHWVEGGVYPKPQQVIQDDGLKLTGDLMPVMTKLPRVAPSGLMRYEGNGLGDEFSGNLFSAEFNTGRIIRHILNPDGATYTTEDTPFITAAGSDIHPTDVLQDADGSLLVVITGGWFIEGCPLSRVAKPDVLGGIYRIRKNGAPRERDPRGLSLDFDKLSPDEVVGYLSDARFAVRDKAIDALVAKGDAAVEPLLGVLGSGDEAERTSAVFALYRAGADRSLEGVRAALEDDNPAVRTAAARVLGLARDTKAVRPLMELVQRDEPSVRRQAATALGQIGDPASVQALLNASMDVEDRFVEHAIIHSLTLIGEPAPMLESLHHPSPKVRRAAVIALDQMDGSPLDQEDLKPFLESEDDALRSTGIWLASHHPEWGSTVIDFLEKNMGKRDRAAAELTALSDLMVSFSSDRDLQRLVAAKLGDPATPVEEKLSLLEVVNRAPLKEIPGIWVAGMGTLLRTGDDEVRSAVLGLVESRNVSQLERDLDEILRDENTPVDFRLKALGARLVSAPTLSESEFDMVLDHMGPDRESPIRQSAVRLLGRAELTDGQLLELAGHRVPDADLFLLPNLIEAFQGNENPEVGLALVGALQGSSDRLDNLSEQDLQNLFGFYPSSVREASAPLLDALHERHAERLSRLREMENQLVEGDVGEGRKIFFGKGTCSSCHAVGTEGGDFGPDLTNIGEIRSRHDMLEAIVYPNASFAREYETFNVVTRTNTYMGVIAEQLTDAVIVTIGPAPGIRIPRQEIVSIEPHSVSMMPPGLDQQLNQQELSDLMAFLEALPYRIDRLIEARERR